MRADNFVNVSPETDHAAWPGIKLTEGEVPLLPTTNSKKGPWSGKDWGAPVGVLTAPGSPWEAAPGPVDQGEVLGACRSFLNSGRR